MSHQHGGRHRAHAAGHRGDGIHDGRGRVKVRIAYDGVFFRVPVGGHVDDRLTGPDMGRRQAPRRTRRRYEDVRLTGDGGQIGGSGVAHRHRGVPRQQQHGRGPTHHRRAPDDHRPLPGAIDAVVIQQHRHRLRRAGSKALRAAQIHSRGGRIRHAVHVLFRQEPAADRRLRLPQVGRQGPQQQAPMDGCIAVDGVDGSQQLLRRHVPRQGADLHVHAAQRAPL